MWRRWGLLVDYRDNQFHQPHIFLPDYNQPPSSSTPNSIASDLKPASQLAGSLPTDGDGNISIKNPKAIFGFAANDVQVHVAHLSALTAV